VAATTGHAQTREHILLARRSRSPTWSSPSNKVDAVDDEELLDLVELEVRELLTKNSLPATTSRSSAASAFKALEATGRRGDPALRLHPGS